MTESAKIDKLIPDPRNANKGTPRGQKALDDSLRRYGAGRSIVLDRENRIICGNKTVEMWSKLGQDDLIIIDTDGSHLVAVRRTDLDLEEDDGRARALATYDNRVGQLNLEWDMGQLGDLDVGILGELWTDVELKKLGIALGDGEENEDEGRLTLAERFVVPPFSVLDARQGYWQSRKTAWISLGIESELGRGGPPGGSPRPAATVGEDGHTVRGDGHGRPLYAALYASGNPSDLKKHYDYGADKPWEWHKKHRQIADSHGNITGAPPLPEYADFGMTYAAPGTSIFDPVLCEVAYRWFCPPAPADILDPFAGGSVRGIVAHLLGHHYTGIDLSEMQIDANREQADRITPESTPRWVVGDSRNLQELLAADEQFDFIFSCPPYFDLEIYSDDGRDLSNCGDYEGFIEAYNEIVAQAVGRLRDDRFACFVVGDIRDRNGFYRNFVSDTIAAFQNAGMTLYNEAILITAYGSLPFRVIRQVQSMRKLGKTHQNVLIFYKGDPQAIKMFGDVEMGNPEDF